LDKGFSACSSAQKRTAAKVLSAGAKWVGLFAQSVGLFGQSIIFRRKKGFTFTKGETFKTTAFCIVFKSMKPFGQKAACKF